MPHLIPRQQAIDEINSTLEKGDCLVCHILETENDFILDRGKHTTSVLSKYPRTWGQTMILLNEHKTAVTELTKEEWEELTEKSRVFAIRIERNLKPLRCFISSLGAAENLPNTCPHIHFNIIPVYNSGDKPSEIYTWEKGVYAGSEDEWKELLKKLG